jgi:hypothetical protein
MTIVVDTEKESRIKFYPPYNTAETRGTYNYDFDNLIRHGRKTKDVFVVFYFSNIETDFSSDELTSLACISAESSFKEEWDKEDDSYWDSY